MKYFLIAIIALFTLSCATQYPIVEQKDNQTKNPVVISVDPTSIDESIRKLAYKGIDIPAKISLALYNTDYVSFNDMNEWIHDNLKLMDRKLSFDTLKHELEKNLKITKTIIIPEFAPGDAFSLHYVRDLAARSQAQFLVCYSIKADSWTEFKTGKNHPKAVATIEYLLLDTKSGLIVHSGIETAASFTKKHDQQMSHYETMKACEREAVVATLTKVGKAVNFIFGDEPSITGLED